MYEGYCTIADADAIIITYGRIAAEALKAAGELKEKGISVAILLVEYIKPFDSICSNIFGLLAKNIKNVVFLEEEVRTGGFGMLMYEKLTSNGDFKNTKFRILAPEENFVVPNKNESIFDAAGVSAKYIVDTIEQMMK